MTVIILATANDKNRWNEYVVNHPHGTAYHRYSWLSAVEQAYQHSAIAWLALDENQNIVGLLATIKIAPPIGSAKLSALPFCDVGGALADNSSIEKALLDAVLSYCQLNNISVFEHRQSALQEESSNNDIEASAKVRMLLPLPDDSEALFNGFKSKLRSQIRKSEKNGLTASTGRDQKHLDGFYQVFTRNMRDLGSPVHSKQWFEAILSKYGDNIIIANVYSDDVVVGAGIVLFNGDKCSIPWASTNADYNRLAPNMMLYWTLLAYATDHGAKEFDFGRSTPNEGTFKFKKQWGAEPLALNWVNYQNGIALVENNATGNGKLRQLIETVWKKLPVPLTVTIGPKVRKFISL